MFFSESAETQRLKAELHSARYFIVRRVPEEYKPALQSFDDAKNLEDLLKKLHDVIEDILEITKPMVSSSTCQQRICCPLCHEQADSPYTEGFAFPEGLRRHLRGYGSMLKCEVMRAAFGLAHDCKIETFLNQRTDFEQKRLAILEERRKTETLYKTALSEPAELLDQSWNYRKEPENLSWAEARILDLGFNLRWHGNIKSFELEDEQVIVFADPRETGRITFRVFPKLPSATLRAKPVQCYFELRDQWKHDLRSKFASRFEQAKQDLR